MIIFILHRRTGLQIASGRAATVNGGLVIFGLV